MSTYTAFRFNIAKSTVHNTVKTVSSHIVGVAAQFIRWPNQDEIPKVATAFKERAGFPGKN